MRMLISYKRVRCLKRRVNMAEQKFHNAELLGTKVTELAVRTKLYLTKTTHYFERDSL